MIRVYPDKRIIFLTRALGMAVFLGAVYFFSLSSKELFLIIGTYFIGEFLFYVRYVEIKDDKLIIRRFYRSIEFPFRDIANVRRSNYFESKSEVRILLLRNGIPRPSYIIDKWLFKKADIATIIGRVRGKI